MTSAPDPPAPTAPGNPVLAELRDDRRGRLTYRGGRYLLIRPETLAALHRAIESVLGDRADDCLASGGRAGGARATSRIEGEPADRVLRLLAMGTAIGWGGFTLEELSPRRMVIAVHGSPFADAYGKSSRPVCHLTRGVLETLAKQIFGPDTRTVETTCAATGASLCRFETA